MRKIADSEDYKVPATIEDPQVLNEVESALKTLGYADTAK
jgi:propionyl-CoA synthetase